MAENLNVGTMIPGIQDMEDNGIPEKYCYEDTPFQCNTYGGLYQWDEIMQYDTDSLTQGICPVGWLIPKISDWNALINSINDPGNEGKHLKESGYDHWNEECLLGLDTYGFTGLPGGWKPDNFIAITFSGYFWSSTQVIGREPFARVIWLQCNSNEISIESHPKYKGLSVRCIKAN
jgi:uncharacterized protein (TIGR02145 family)